MRDTREQKAAGDQGLSRRDFLKLCSLTMGVLALPPGYARLIEQTLTSAEPAASDRKLYFQWQNEFVCKTVYPMREVKLRHFLLYYEEVDVWSKYKDRDIVSLKSDVFAYKSSWELNASAALKQYSSLRDYFFKENVRSDYSNFWPIDEAELTEIFNFHVSFVDSWPKDIRNERSTVETMIQSWVSHRDQLLDQIALLESRQQNMSPSNPQYVAEGKELVRKKSITLPMAEQELAQLRAFLKTYEKIEKRKREWFDLSASDPNFKIPEAEFLTKFPPELEITLQDLARWRLEEYAKSLADKNRYELLDLIKQRFDREPERYPAWLQYMVVHFSGMRYASAHGSWADPKNLLMRLRAPKIEEEIQRQTDSMVEVLCKEKIAVYESTGSGGAKPALAGAKEKEWQEKIGWFLPRLKVNSPDTRRRGLIDLRKLEDEYALTVLSTEDIVASLMKIKSSFAPWAWKEIVRYTPLRVTEVVDLGWEKLTSQEEEARNAQQSYDIRTVIDAWENNDVTAWRGEHGRTHEVFVTRVVCNEAAEHCQHIRGQLPPGGLADKPQWYLDAEGTLPGAYFVRPTKAEEYTQGASILWLRFADFSTDSPDPWQTARQIETKNGVGILPDVTNGQWNYILGEPVTRSRTVTTSDNQLKREEQWLRWIHEATVAEVAETADGMKVLTFETALPDDDDATSTVGMVSMPLEWHLSDGDEDTYNRSFVGYIPEGEVPVGHLKKLLDWNRIFNNNRG